jgi:Mrp family chromosome partitioning ATPase
MSGLRHRSSREPAGTGPADAGEASSAGSDRAAAPAGDDLLGATDVPDDFAVIDNGHVDLSDVDATDDLLASDDRPVTSLQPASPASSSALSIAIGDVVVHRAPVTVTSPLRYVLASGDTPTRLSVTSSIHGEGVTAISRTLAGLIAHDWRASTCWIDLNWWKGPTPPNERAAFRSTIADAMNGVAITDDLPMHTSIPGLAMVAAGEMPEATRSSLPRNEKLWRIVDELSSSFDYVVLDLPPVLVTADALALGRLADAYLLVVRQGSASSNQVRTALRAMNTIPCLGTMLNVARSNVPRWLRSSTEAWAFDERP